MNWRWISLSALLAAVVIGSGAYINRGPAPVTSDEAPPLPGYYLKDAVITETREDGSLNIRLIANRIEQHPEDDSYTMSSVRANYFQSPEHEWTMTALRGFVPADSRVVHLDGDVELRPADSDATSFLRTDALAIDTEKRIAYSTHSPVDITFGRQEMTVKSFVADLKSEKIRLESINGRVRAR